MIAPGTTETKPEIPTACPKCNRSWPEYRYDEVHNEMAMHCLCCGYRWCVPPLDRNEKLHALAEMQRQQQDGLCQVLEAIQANKHGITEFPPLGGDAKAPAGDENPSDPVYRTHPELREHVNQAYMLVETASIRLDRTRLAAGKKKSVDQAMQRALDELMRAKEVMP